MKQEESAEPRPAAGLAAARSIAWLAAVLLFEYAALSLAFDAPVGLRWGPIGLGSLGPLLLSVATAAVLMGGPRLLEAFASLEPARESRPGRRVAWFVGHVASTVGLFLVTAAMEAAEEPLLWAPAFSSLGLASASCLFAAIWEPEALLRLLARQRGLIALALGLGLVAWLAGLASESLWPTLSKFTLHSAAFLLAPLLTELEVRPERLLLGSGSFRVRVAPECSGLEGMGLQLAFVGTWLWWARGRLRWPQALVLLPLALLGAGLLNVLRIVALMLVGSWWSPEIAVGGFHSKAGWIASCALSLAVVTASLRWRFVARTAPAEGQEAVGLGELARTGAAPWLLPLAAWLATALLTGLLSGAFDLLHPLRHVAALAVLMGLRSAAMGWWPRDISSPAVGWGLAAFALWWILEWPDAESVAAGDALRSAVGALPAAAAVLWLAARVAGSVLIVPVIEELAFRGYLMRRLASRDFETLPAAAVGWSAIAVSSLAFGALHQRFVAGTLAGLCFALAHRQRGRLADAIVAHAVANALVAASVLLAGRWTFWA